MSLTYFFSWNGKRYIFMPHELSSSNMEFLINLLHPSNCTVMMITMMNNVMLASSLSRARRNPAYLRISGRLPPTPPASVHRLTFSNHMTTHVLKVHLNNPPNSHELHVNCPRQMVGTRRLSHAPQNTTTRSQTDKTWRTTTYPMNQQRRHRSCPQWLTRPS